MPEKFSLLITDEDTIANLSRLIDHKIGIDVISIIGVVLVPFLALLVAWYFSRRQTTILKNEYEYKIFFEKLNLYNEVMLVYDKLKQKNFFFENDFVFVKFKNLSFLFGNQLKIQVDEFFAKYVNIDKTKDEFRRQDHEDNFIQHLDSILHTTSELLAREFDKITFKRKKE